MGMRSPDTDLACRALGLWRIPILLTGPARRNGPALCVIVCACVRVCVKRLHGEALRSVTYGPELARLQLQW